MRVAWVLLVFLLLFTCACSSDASMGALPQGNTQWIVVKSPSPTPLPITLSTPSVTTHSGELIDDLAFLSDISPDLRALVIEDYPWKHEVDTERLLNKEASPFFMQIEANDEPPFGESDLNAGSLYYGMSLEEALTIIGQPRVIYSYIEAAYGEHHLKLYYHDGNELMFSGAYGHNQAYGLISVRIRADLHGPRGIQIGQVYTAALQSFKLDPPALGDNEDLLGCKTLYAANMVLDDYDARLRPVAPSGTLESPEYYNWENLEDARSYIRYNAPVYPYSAEELESGRIEFAHRPTYFLYFSIQEDVIVEYSWGIDQGPA